MTWTDPELRSRRPGRMAICIQQPDGFSVVYRIDIPPGILSHTFVCCLHHTMKIFPNY